jgi:hypothetical protein
MPTFIADNGDDFVVQQLDRSTRGGLTETFKVNGKTGATTLPAATTIGGKTPMTGSLYSVVSAGRSTAGSLTLAGAVITDKVVAIVDLASSPPADLQTGFETAITVTGHIAQSSGTDLSAHTILFILQHL